MRGTADYDNSTAPAEGIDVVIVNGEITWLHGKHLGTSPERAQEIAQEHCRPAEDFHWYKVGKNVGNVRNQGPELIEPLSLSTDVDDWT